ncbi:MAG: histidinol-phosphate transaminase [Deltaproteobacteria bacterium]|nr:histidinol-phosphate transaminase [Deltaproteobacteria bacterium]
MAAGKLATRFDLAGVQAYRIPDRERAGLLRLDVNEHAVGAAPEIVQAVREELTGERLATYPNYGAWHTAAARYFGVQPEQVTCTAGGDEAIKAIFEAFLLPGRPVVMPEPGFDMFALWAQVYGSPLRGVALKTDFTFDADAWFAALDGEVGLAILTTPNNPTGTLVPPAVIDATLQRVQCPVLVDETYIEFVGSSVASWVERYPHLLVVRSFSKVYGLAGLRVGAVLAQAENIQTLRKLLPPFNVARPAIAASLAAMQHPDLLAEHVANIAATRAEFAAQLQGLGAEVGPLHANFVLARLGERASAVVAALAAEGILVRDRSQTHPTTRGCVRIGLGSPRQMARVVAALRKHLQPAPRLRALVFDMDGPLVDTARSYRVAIVQTAQALLARYGAPAAVVAQANLEAVEKLKRRGGLNNDWDCCHALVQELGGAVAYDQVVETFQSLYWGDDGDGLIQEEEFCVPAELRARLRQRYATAIVTGRPRVEALRALEIAGATDTWAPDRVAAMEDGPNKPAPDGILRMLEHLGVAAAEAAYLGDSVDDMRAARAAGVRAVGVLPPQATWTDGLCERLVEAGAEWVFASVGEVMQWLEQ